MAFPTSPTNGQQSVVNGITYQYASATNSWTRIGGTANTIIATGNITAGNLVSVGTVEAAGTVTAGEVIYTNVDGTTGQVLTTYGNGITHWSSASTGRLPVYVRAGGFIQVQIFNGFLNVVGRAGNIAVPIS